MKTEKVKRLFEAKEFQVNQKEEEEEVETKKITWNERFIKCDNGRDGFIEMEFCFVQRENKFIEKN